MIQKKDKDAESSELCDVLAVSTLSLYACGIALSTIFAILFYFLAKQRNINMFYVKFIVILHNQVVQFAF